MIGVAMIVGFSFQGTELIGIAAGESENPEKNIPRAVRQVFWRILLFYVFAILIISLIIPYTDPSLLRNDVKDISVSPFTLVFQHAGLLSAAAIMNAVILTAVLSAGNSGCTRPRVCSIPWPATAKRRASSRSCRVAACRVTRCMPPR
jgi:lysine-specific permease